MSELDTVRAECQGAGVLYEDPDFPAQPSSLYWDDRSQQGVEWKRPKEICADPKFISETASRHDLDQGALGNCWYLAACGALTTQPALFTRVCPPDQDFGDGYVGAFQFNFWRFGDWEEVLVDDRLPTKDGKLLFCHNREDAAEFWSALMEKAYAKLHGCYQALEGGYAIDGLVDFTGGIGEFIDLTKEVNPAKLWRRLRAMDRMNSFLCAAIEGGGDKPETKLENGLLTNHVYSITKIHQITREGESVRLIRLRNPWGSTEWNGAWSDGSAEWNDVSAEEREALGLVNENEGEFWMLYQDWVTNFHNLQICHLEAQSMKWKKLQNEWNIQSHHGAWRKGVNAGGCGQPPNQDTYWSNPQYFVEINGGEDDADGESALVVSIMQKYSRVRKTLERKERTEEAIGVDLYKLLSEKPADLAGFHADPSALQLVQKMYDYEYFRERSRQFDLDGVAGVYCIIPMTYAPETEGEFLLRVLSELPMQSGEMVGDDDQEGGDKPSKFTQLFNKLAGDDGVIDARELKKMVNQGIKREQDDEFSRETCRALIQSVTGDRKGSLNAVQCKNVWRAVRRYQQTFDQYDKDSSGLLDIKELRQAFKSLGHTLSKKALSAIAEKYCAKSENLTLDEFILCVSKVAVTNDVFNRRGGQGKKKVELSKEEMLELALS